MSGLEQDKDVLGAQGGPESDETVIRIGEGATTADRDEPRVADLREDHGRHSLLHPPGTDHGAPAIRSEHQRAALLHLPRGSRQAWPRGLARPRRPAPP